MSTSVQNNRHRRSTTRSKQHRPDPQEEALMRKISLYFVIGFAVVSEALSFAVLIITHNIEATLLFQVPAWMFFYRILCYLFPTQQGTNPILTLLQLLRKHP